MNVRTTSLLVALAFSTCAACAYGPSLPAEEEVAPPGAPRAPESAGAAEMPRETATPPVDAGADREIAAEAGAGAATGADAAAGTDAAVEPRDASPPVGARSPGATDLVITEILFDPAGAEPDGEWIEMTNLASVPVDLRGVVLRDGAGRTHTIGATVVVAPGAFVVLARSVAASVAGGAPATSVVYEYGRGLSSSAGIILANGASGSIALEYGGAVLSSVPYGTFGGATGGSLSLRTVAHEASPGAARFCSSAPSPGLPPSCP